jgi:hypothetical protein
VKFFKAVWVYVRQEPWTVLMVLALTSAMIWQSNHKDQPILATPAATVPAATTSAPSDVPAAVAPQAEPRLPEAARPFEEAERIETTQKIEAARQTAAHHNFVREDQTQSEP